jgi:hypothetical protein
MSRDTAPRPAHEPTDASPRTVGALASVVVVLVALGIGAGVETVRSLSGGAAHVLPASEFAQGAGERPDVELAWERCEREGEARLAGYAWVDRRAGTVRIPLERAMVLVAGDEGRASK